MSYSWDSKLKRSMKCVLVCAIFSSYCLWCAILSGRGGVWALARMVHWGLEATGSHLHIWCHWYMISLCIWLEPLLAQGVNRSHPSTPLIRVQGVCPPQTMCNFATEIAWLNLNHFMDFLSYAVYACMTYCGGKERWKRNRRTSLTLCKLILNQKGQ